MAEVKHFIDQSSIQQDADFLKDALDQILAKLEAIKKVRVDLSGLKSFGDASKLAGDLQKAQEDLLKTTEKLAVANKKLEQSREAQLKADTQQVKLDREKQKALTDLQKEKERVLKQQEKEVNNLDKLNNEYTQLNNRYKEASAASLKRGAELLKEAKGNNDLFLSLLKTDKAYTDNTRRAKELSAQLLLLEQNIGRSQRNVGNYAGSFNNLNRQFGLIANELPSLTISVQQFALALSNNLPLAAEEIRNAQREIRALQAEGKAAPSIFKVLGNALFSFQVGISIFVTAIVAFLPKIIDFFSKLSDGIPTLEDLSEETKKYTELLADERTKLEVLFKTATDANVPLKARLEAVKELRQNYGAYLKDFSDEEILAGQAAAAYEKLSEAIIKTSRARAAEQLLQGKDLEILRNEEKIAKIREKAQKDAEAARLEIQRRSNLPLRQRELLAPQESPDLIFKAARETVETLRKANRDIEKEKADLLKTILSNQVDPFTDESGGKGRSSSQRIRDFYKDELRARFEQQKLVLEQEKQFQQEFFENDLNGFEDRLQAAENFFDLELALNKRSQEFELAELERQRIQNGLKTEQVQEQRQAIILKYQIAEFNIIKANQDNIIKITQQYYRSINEEQEKANKFFQNRTNRDFEKEKAELERQRDEELLAFREQANATNLTVTEQKEGELKIREKYNVLILKAEAAKVRAILALEEDPVKREQLLARLAAIEIELSNLETENYIKNNEKKKKSDEELAALRRRLEDELLNLTREFTLGRFDAEKNRLQEDIFNIEERKRRELDFINATVTNEIEKQARITNAEKRAQNEREKLEFRQRQLDIQRARFEKVFQIAQIIGDTARAIAKAVAASPLTGGQPFAGINAAIGAVQVATVLAQPIPKFKTGKGDYDKYEGPAWVGDGGKSEMIFREDGSIERTPSTPTLTYVGRNDIIHPDADALVRHTMAKQGEVFNYSINGGYAFEKMSDTLAGELKNVTKAIQNKREWYVTMKPDGLSLKTRDGNRFKTYLNNNLQF